jgi:hypothetical protein
MMSPSPSTIRVVMTNPTTNPQLPWKLFDLEQYLGDSPFGATPREYAYQAMCECGLEAYHPPHVFSFLLGFRELQLAVENFDLGLLDEDMEDDLSVALAQVEMYRCIFEWGLVRFVRRRWIQDGTSEWPVSPWHFGREEWEGMVPGVVMALQHDRQTEYSDDWRLYSYERRRELVESVQALRGNPFEIWNLVYGLLQGANLLASISGSGLSKGHDGPSAGAQIVLGHALQAIIADFFELMPPPLQLAVRESLDD